MAKSPKKSTKGKKTAKKKPEDDAGLSVAIEIDAPEDLPSYYVNHIEVSHTRHEFGLYFAEVPGKFSRSALDEIKETGRITLEPFFKAIVPPTLVKGLIDALQSQKDKFESEYGSIENDDKK